jgi:Zn-dependent protease
MSDTPSFQPPEPDPLWSFPQRSFTDPTFVEDGRVTPATAPVAHVAPHTAIPHATQPIQPTYVPMQGQAVGQQRRTSWGKKAGGGGAIAATVAKFWIAFKSLAILLKFKTALSVVISIGVYTLFWGWKFAVGFVIILFIHEMGHVVVLRAQGIKATAPMFIPLMGAFISYKTPPRSVAQEAAGALAGPFAGLLASGAALVAADALDSQLLRAIAYTGFFLNLFNLLPALPLDGGRVAGALHPAVWFAGMAGVVAYLIWRPTPILFLVLLIGGFEALKRWRAFRSGRANVYYALSTTIRLRIASAYVVVAGLCVAGMVYSFIPASGVS